MTIKGLTAHTISLDEGASVKVDENGMVTLNDVSRHFTIPTYYEQTVARGILEREETPEAITYFAEKSRGLSDHAYWFLLSTLWVSYTGHSDLEQWKTLFGSNRKKRKGSIMKPSEERRFDALPHAITVYRAHRPNETDWIAYTLDEPTVKRFAAERGVTVYSEYQVKKRDVLALFLRRGEHEIIVLDRDKSKFIKEWDVTE